MRMPSRCLALALVTFAAASTLAHGQTAGAAKPNVVLIITDDLGSADLSSYGARDIRTPNIDSLARDGVKLTQFYANGPVCTPTRAGLISGRYQQRYRLERPLGNDGTPAGEGGLPARGHSLPQLLKHNGYATALVGKWHLGYRAEHSPRAHGFDYFFGLKSGFIDYYAHTGGDGKPDFWENDQPVQRDGYSTDLITERSVRFLEEHASGPFFLEVAYNAPHWPYQPPDTPSKAIDNARHLQPHHTPTSTRADYVAMVERVDRGVGQILRALDGLKIAGQTMVIFTNDNGGEWLSSNAPLFHRKATLWEGGIRVPALIRWPGRLPRGKVSAQVGITMDLHASILAATGTPAPESAKLEGLDLLPILEGRAPIVERTLFWRANMPGRSQRAVRSGDWKVLLDGGPGSPGTAGIVLVYNLRTDVSERHDLANQKQDVANRLTALLEAWEKDVDTEGKANEKSATSPQ
jgi:arylsulfatase A-like enzyme